MGENGLSLEEKENCSGPERRGEKLGAKHCSSKKNVPGCRKIVSYYPSARTKEKQLRVPSLWERRDPTKSADGGDELPLNITR